MKAKFSTDCVGRVTVEYDDYDGERAERTFTCPPSGGYVRELVRGEAKQVCDGLARMGNTLFCNSRDALPALIRSEYRKMRRAWAGEL